MANFPTHLAVGTITSGMLATLTVASGMVPPKDIVTLALAGAVGGILPDIDLKESRPSKMIFFGLGLFFSLFILFAAAPHYSIAELWIIWLGSFLAVRYIGHLLFHHYANHRGVFHSLLAACFFLLFTATLFHKVLGADPGISWLAGFFLFFGYLTHLLLDEIYSVDFSDNRIKRSFGTALKLIEHRSLGASLAMGLAAAAVFYFTPPFMGFFEVVSESNTWTFLWERLLPEGHWFGLDLSPRKLADLNL